MSSSSESICLQNVRVTGVDGVAGQGTAAAGIVAGLKYFRKFNKNGVDRPAHVELVLTRNHVRYDGGGTAINTTDTMKLEAWNSDKDEGLGKGIADNLAKWYSVGKAFSVINARLRVYKRRVYLSNGSVVTNVDGTPLLVPASSLVVRSMSQLTPHNESAKTIAREVANYNSGMTQKSFFSRPPNWNNPAHPDAALWKEIIGYRKNAKYEGTNYYGNAKVCQVSGTTPADGYPVNESDIGGGAPAPVQAAPAAGGISAALMATMSPEQLALLQGQVAPVAPVAQIVGTDTPF